MSDAFCCVHPQQRIDSPEPPSRLPTTIDGIFAAAALPDDHPHAFKFAAKKPDAHTSIIRSPNIGNKIKAQFQRKSVKALRSDDEYDGDAKPMTSKDVVYSLGCDAQTSRPLRFGSVGTLGPSGLPLGRDLSMSDFGTSVLKSLESLSVDLLKRSKTQCPTPEHATMLEQPSMPSSLPQSSSSPNLLSDQLLTGTALRRTQSYVALGSTLEMLKQERPLNAFSGLLEKPCGSNALPSISHAEGCTDATKPNCNDPTGVSHQRDSADYTSTQEPECMRCARQSDGTHLHTMNISQQLRSLSALSDQNSDDGLLDSQLQPWTFVKRATTDECTLSTEKRALSTCSHERMTSATLDGTRSPAASSIYSRATSIKQESLSLPDCTRNGSSPHELLWTMDGAKSDWPLKSDTVRETPPLSPADEIDANVQITPMLAEHCPLTIVSTTPDVDKASVAQDGVLSDQPAIPSKDSLSNMTERSKRSSVLRHLSPLKRAVKKRRSIFKFLRPGSQKQTRSISSPMLPGPDSSASCIYDGPSDEAGILTVEYEMSDHPLHTRRAVSTSHLDLHQQVTASHLTVPALPFRRPSLANYERSLTALGDDRRRPSAINIRKLEEIEEDDRRQSMDLHRRLSRAKPLNDEPTGLMAHALEKHQQEKALFRSASKQKESLAASHASSLTPYTSASLSRTSTLQTNSQVRHGGALSPLDRLGIVDPAGLSPKASMLLPPAPAAPGASPHGGRPSSDYTASRRASSVAPSSQTPQTPQPRLGTSTSLSAWSRYPSHTRAERCGSAGANDAIITRDFAMEINPEHIQASDECEADITPASKKSGKRWGSRLPKSPSGVFSGLVRYYSNIFSSSDSQAAQNRRTSIAAGGWLADPDLEQLPPASSHEPTVAHHDHHLMDHLKHLEHVLEESVRKDVEYVEQEAMKLQKLVKDDIEYVEEEVELVEAEAEKLMHIKPTLRVQSPFHQGSPFSTDNNAHPHTKRHSTFIGPMDDPEEGPAPLPINAEALRVGSTSRDKKDTADDHERDMGLDGTLDACGSGGKKPQTAKAEAWSDAYRRCLLHPQSTDASIDQDTMGMPPPALKPVKARSPDQPKRLDPQATIRRFPSVTVVDDRKGHSRSISLISVKVDKGGVLRSSTHDLISLIEAREREERERLLHGTAFTS